MMQTGIHSIILAPLDVPLVARIYDEKSEIKLQSNLQSEIEQLFREYESIWDSQNYGDFKALWDTDDPEPFYLAEEQED